MHMRVAIWRVHVDAEEGRESTDRLVFATLVFRRR